MTTVNEVEAGLEDYRQAGAERLSWQADRFRRYQMYFDGEVPPPAMLNTAEREAFRQFLAEAGCNWAELVVVAVAERLQVTGFRFGGGNASEAAWALWQGSGMDADAELVQTAALIGGVCPVLVQPDESNPTGVEISPESPEQACVIYQPGTHRRRAAAYKAWAEDDLQTEYVITPDWIATWHGRHNRPEVEPNPAGLVTMVDVIPQPRLIGAPRSELKPVLPIQDRINLTIFNRMVATDYGAFRQIWASGLKLAREIITENEETGETTTRPVRPFNVGPDRLLVNENPEGRFGSFPESTLAGYLSAVEQDVNQLAAITQTPPHYLLGSMVNLSADAIKAAEAGLVSKVKRRALHIGEAWEEIMRIALGFVGDPAAADVGAECMWADFETRSESQLVDALQKMSTLGVPTTELWRRWGASEQDIARWQQAAAEEQAQAAANQAAALGAADIARLLSGGPVPGA